MMAAPNLTNFRGLRIAFVLLGDINKASSRVRGYWIGEELQALGYDVSYHQLPHRCDYLRMLAVAMRQDVLIFQKQYSRYDVALLRIVKRIGKLVFFDIDDAPSLTERAISKRNAANMMREAHGVFAGSRNLEALAQQAGGNVHFVPSGIRLAQYKSRAAGSSKHVCLGWIGNGAYYVDDLVSTLEVPLRRIAAQRDIRLKIVGACGEPRLSVVFGDIKGLTLDLIDQVDWSNPQAVSEAIADFDIGLYPLIENKFNIYKCAFKALEYMATSIPVVASAVGANADVICHEKDGYLVSTADGWTACLSHLITDVEKRKALGKNGRLKVEEHYSTNALARQISDIIQAERQLA